MADSAAKKRGRPPGRDPVLEAKIRARYNDPGKRWTLGEIARAVGASESTVRRYTADMPRAAVRDGVPWSPAVDADVDEALILRVIRYLDAVREGDRPTITVEHAETMTRIQRCAPKVGMRLGENEGVIFSRALELLWATDALDGERATVARRYIDSLLTFLADPNSWQTPTPAGPRATPVRMPPVALTDSEYEYGFNHSGTAVMGVSRDITHPFGGDDER